MVIAAGLGNDIIEPPPLAVSTLLKYACPVLRHSIFYFGFGDNDGGTEGRGGGTLIKDERSSIKRII